MAELNEAPIVADVTIDHEFDPKIKHPKNKSWALQEMQKYGLRVDRQGFGIISFAKNKIDESFKYLNTIGEVAAFEVLPMVLKRGTIIHTEGEHKNYGHGTITIAARVKINQKPAVVAAIVKETKGHNYKVHRIKTPDGTQFVYEKEKADSTAVNGDIKHSLRSPIESATDTKITQNSPGVNSNSMQSAEKNTNAERYSIDIDDIADDPEQIKEIKLRSNLLREQLELTDGTRRSVPKTRAFAAQLLKEYKSTYSEQDLSADLINLYNYMADLMKDKGMLTDQQRIDVQERAAQRSPLKPMH